MTNRALFVEKPIAFCLLLALTCLLACNQSNQTSPPPTAAMAASTAEKVFVVFEGPWAFVADPKDASKVLALAPKTKAHRDLNVSASNSAILTGGVYDLSVPAHGAPTTVALDSTFAQAKIDAKSLQKAIDDKTGRYAIRLPKPEAYVAAKRIRSRFGPKYPPDASTEQNYATSVSLRYTVNSLSGFSLSGSPDSGAFNPFLLQVDTPVVNFVIEPSQPDDPLDNCHTHTREAFRDLVKYLSLTLFVDFPDDSPDCRKNDPQGAPAAKAASAFPTTPLAMILVSKLLDSSLSELASLGTIDRTNDAIVLVANPVQSRAHNLIATAYLFGLHGSACKAPILFLTVS